MAINDFSNQNIQDTYQRVVQTDGTNRLADGTGSIFIPISSSHAITASHALFAVSASHEVTFELSSSHAVNADTASFATNFIASGDISSSGTITAKRFDIKDQQLVVEGFNNLTIGNSNRGLILHGSTLSLGSGDVPVFAEGNITASGEISASGNLTISQSLTFGHIANYSDPARINFSSSLIIGNPIENDYFQIIDENHYFYVNGGQALILNGNSNKINLGYGGGITQVSIGKSGNSAVLHNFGTTGEPNHQQFGQTWMGKYGDMNFASTATLHLTGSGHADYTGTALEVEGNIISSGSLDIIGNVTMSGNISSSGTLIANSAYVDSLNHKDGTDTQISFNTDQVRLNAGGVINTNWYTYGTQFLLPITASGQISASGTGQHYFGGSINNDQIQGFSDRSLTLVNVGTIAGTAGDPGIRFTNSQDVAIGDTDESGDGTRIEVKETNKSISLLSNVIIYLTI